MGFSRRARQTNFKILLRTHQLLLVKPPSRSHTKVGPASELVVKAVGGILCSLHQLGPPFGARCSLARRRNLERLLLSASLRSALNGFTATHQVYRRDTVMIEQRIK